MKHTSIHISQNLQCLINEHAGPMEGTFNDKIMKIEERQCAAVEFYIRAMTQRLQVD